MDKRLKVNFAPFSNFGDTTVPYFLQKMGVPFRFAHHSIHKKVLMTGSIITPGTKKDTYVWGSGIMYAHLNPVPDAIYAAVRGPRTLERARVNGADVSDTAFGDPALLLPRAYTPNVEKEYKLGIIPHVMDGKAYKDYLEENKSKFPNTLVIASSTKCNQIEEFIDNVHKCEKIVSSSLHGIICAQAYGIPSVLSKITGSYIAGDGIKFIDYYESVGNPDFRHIEFPEDENITIENIPINIDLDHLWSKRPWAVLGDDYYVDVDQEDWRKECYLDSYNEKLWLDDHFKLTT